MNAPLRVLSIVSSLCVGGAEKHAVALLNHLSADGFRLYLACLKPDESLLPQVQTDRLHGVLCLDVRRKLDWHALRRLVGFIDTHDIDVLLCTNEYPALYALLAARRARRRPGLVEVFHTTLLRNRKEQLQMLLYRRVFRNFDLLVYVSTAQQAYWRARRVRAKRDIVIHNGVDAAYFHDDFTPARKAATRASAGFAPDDYVVAICATLRTEKAHGDLLRAIALLRERGTEVRALLIGDGPERMAIGKTIGELGLGQSVFITGFQRDVRPFLACSDVVALTSHSVETFSVAALEAMALAKPVVLTRIGGAAEQVTHSVNGLLYDPGDIAALASHIESLRDPATRLAMGQAGMRRVTREFTEAGMVAAYESQLALPDNSRTMQ
jgi:glycosyltransferase involved in cell wall biosynthesis